MDFEALAELLVPLTALVIVGGLIAMRMLKPYGDRILELVREIQEERHQALTETREMQHLRDRIEMLAERQDFLETLVERRLDDGEQAQLERMRRDELGPGAGPASAARAPGSAGEERRGGDGTEGSSREDARPGAAEEDASRGAGESPGGRPA